MASIDIKNAYHHWPIHPRDRPYLCFQWEGKYFCHNSLPFGLSVAPREWQRAMMAVVNFLRVQGVQIWVYLDDFLLIAENPEILRRHVDLTVQLLDSLGLTINLEKSELNPVQVLTYLGFNLDLQGGFIQIPPQKLAKVQKELVNLQRKILPSVRKVAMALGQVRALLFALPQARLLTTQLQAHVHQCWGGGGWDSQHPLPLRPCTNWKC